MHLHNRRKLKRNRNLSLKVHTLIRSTKFKQVCKRKQHCELPDENCQFGRIGFRRPGKVKQFAASEKDSNQAANRKCIWQHGDKRDNADDNEELLVASLRKEANESTLQDKHSNRERGASNERTSFHVGGKLQRCAQRISHVLVQSEKA